MTDMFIALGGPVIGILGVLAGTALNEYLRRGQRAEQYSAIVFNKRLEADEALLSLVHQGSSVAEEIVRNPDLSAEERHALISKAILAIATHTDRNVLYIDEELGAHCTALLMGTEDIFDTPEPEKQQLLDDYHKMLRETHRMILEDSGAEKIKKLFRSINKPRITSPVIERIRYLRKELRKAE